MAPVDDLEEPLNQLETHMTTYMIKAVVFHILNGQEGKRAQTFRAQLFTPIEALAGRFDSHGITRLFCVINGKGLPFHTDGYQTRISTYAFAPEQERMVRFPFSGLMLYVHRSTNRLE